MVFPKFGRLDILEQFRNAYDPLAISVNAHITLVPPFDNNASPEQLRLHITQAIQNIRPFHIMLQGITGHQGEYLFLNVKRGNDQLIELRDRLYTGLLSAHLLPQYTYVPHLTVGRLPDEGSFFEALTVAQEITATFDTQVREISVYSIQTDGTRPLEFSVTL